MSNGGTRDLTAQCSHISKRVPTRIADRYDVEDLLGQGGAGAAYRVHDRVSGEPVALKLLTAGGRTDHAQEISELFEREYHALVQLAHPRIVRAYDYGIEGDTAYYTMELLDGGDVRELSPMPWQQVCAFMYEICSALALLHSRRLIHRDVTPRNIRRTSDGRSKLIDFGLLAPMGPVGLLGGTAPCVAPEMLHNMALDGRSDLFSLGATAYFALTQAHAFPARRFEELQERWRVKPAPPSRHTPEIPAAVDELVLALLRIDPGSRPKTAAEVMERLLPLLASPPEEGLNVANAHLATPKLIGRGAALGRIRKQLMRTMRRRGRVIIISGAGGVGRSRMIDALVLESKVAGVTTVRAGASDAAAGPYGVASEIARQVLAAAPEVSLKAAHSDPHTASMLLPSDDHGADLRVGATNSAQLTDIMAPSLDRNELQTALRTWLLAVANECPLTIAVDDAERMDEPSAALLASLACEAPQHRLLCALALATDYTSAATDALAVLRDKAIDVRLTPLPLEQVEGLLESVFGDVPNLQLLGARLHQLCGGLPRGCMDLAQHLVDHGAVNYSGGTWTLPAELEHGLLPASMEAALVDRISRLSQDAQRVALLLALSIQARLRRIDLTQVSSIGGGGLDQAINELVAEQLVAGGPNGYALCHTDFARLVIDSASQQQRVKCHLGLAELYGDSQGQVVAAAYHLLHAGHESDGLDRLLAQAQDRDARTRLANNGAEVFGSDQTAKTLELALDAAERNGRATSDLQTLWTLLASMSARGESHRFFYRVADRWLAQLKHDTGFLDWERDDSGSDAATRTLAAVSAADERYEALPESERGLPPADAIKQLAAFVAIAIAVTTRVGDYTWQAKLPGLLAPFTTLHPMVKAMYDNARATELVTDVKLEAARAVWIDVYEQLANISDTDMTIVTTVQAAVGHAIAGIDCMLGVHSKWIAELTHKEQDPSHRVGSYYLLQADALQQGDWEAAEGFRQHAERLALESRTRRMFSSLQWTLPVHAVAADLTGLNQARTGACELAKTCEGWAPAVDLADAYRAYLCGDLDRALATADGALDTARKSGRGTPWTLPMEQLRLDTMIGQGRPADALREGLALLEEYRRQGRKFLARHLSCTVAYAQAELGLLAEAAGRAEAVLEEQHALNITGLQLARSYELRARIAIKASDEPSFTKYAALAAEHYRVGSNSVLGSLYERLMDDADAAGLCESSRVRVARRELSTDALLTRVSTALQGCSDHYQRASQALALLCDGDPPLRGHLLLVRNGALVLAASNIHCKSVVDLVAHAQAHLTLELRDALREEEETLDEVDIATVVGGRHPPGAWQDAAGTDYTTRILRAEVEGGSEIVGVAVVGTRHSTHLRDVTQLAGAVATGLLNAGACMAFPHG